KVTMLKQVGAHVWYLGINNQKKPFDDKRVRQALNYAVNKDAIVRDVLKGTGTLSAGPVLPKTWGADSGLKAYPYDPERAKKLLDQARLTTDEKKRAALYRQAQRILIDDAPWIFVDHEIQTAAHAKRVQGFKLHPSFDLRVETISLK